MAEVDPEDAKLAIGVLRLLHGWSQADLAKKASFASASVRRWEAEGNPPWKSLVQLSEAAGVPAFLLSGALIPMLHHLRRVAFRRPGDDTDYGDLERVVALGAERTTELARGYLRSSLLRAIEADRAQKKEEEANAWRPVPEHREEAEMLWGRLEDCTAEEQDFLLGFDGEFHRWGIVERIANQVLDQGGQDSEKALALADLAFRIAAVVPGEEPWTDRVKGYALAALGYARRRAGRQQEAVEAFQMAADHWNRGAAMPGLLEEERFEALLGGWKPAEE